MNDIIEMILKGDFQRAKKLISGMDEDAIRMILSKVGYDEGSICAYSFVVSLLLENETAELHYLASELLNISFCHYEGGYESSLYHARRAVELNPNDVELLEYLLLFHVLPGKYITKEEANKIEEKIKYLKSAGMK